VSPFVERTKFFDFNIDFGFNAWRSWWAQNQIDHHANDFFLSNAAKTNLWVVVPWSDWVISQRWLSPMIRAHWEGLSSVNAFDVE
jgi:hypothetical protein